MNITRENIDELNTIIKIEITPEDYETHVDKKLREYRRKANMPGFRPGNVPMPIIRKMYRTSVLVEEINKIAAENLYKYIKDNDINLLGSPLQNEQKNKPVDWHEQKEFEFYFDLALQPEVNIDLEALEVPYYNIKFDDTFINQQIDSYRKNFGTQTTPDVSSKEDRIFAKFEELNEDGSIKEGGIVNSASVLSEYVQKTEKFIGLKKGDSLNINVKEIFDNNESEIAALLNISKDKVKDLNSPFKFTVESIHGIELAEINQEFFNKVFPEAGISSEEDFRKRIEKELEVQTEKETDGQFFVDVSRRLLDTANIDLPEPFLKRWLLENDSEKKLTKEAIENDFDKYAKTMKWQIIENQLIKEYKLQVTRDDVKAHIKTWLVKGNEEPTTETENQIESIVENILNNKEQAQRLYDNLYNAKIIDIFKEKVKMKPTEISLDEFINLNKAE